MKSLLSLFIAYFFTYSIGINSTVAQAQSSNSQCAVQFTASEYKDFLLYLANTLKKNSNYSNIPSQGEQEYQYLQNLASHLIAHPFIQKYWAASGRPLTRFSEMKALLIELRPHINKIPDKATDFNSFKAMENILLKIDTAYTEGIVDFSNAPVRPIKISVLDPDSLRKRIQSMSPQERAEKGIGHIIDGIDSAITATPSATAEQSKHSQTYTNNTATSNNTINTYQKYALLSQISFKPRNSFFSYSNSTASLLVAVDSFYSNAILNNGPLDFTGSGYYANMTNSSISYFLQSLAKNKLPTSTNTNILDIMMEAGFLIIARANALSEAEIGDIAMNLSYLIVNTKRFEQINLSLGYAIQITPEQLTSALYTYFIDVQYKSKINPNASPVNVFNSMGQIISRANFENMMKHYNIPGLTSLIMTTNVGDWK